MEKQAGQQPGSMAAEREDVLCRVGETDDARRDVMENRAGSSAPGTGSADDAVRRVVILGAGASGLTAAVSAARTAMERGIASSVKITILEAGQRPARKLSVTGNGRGNLSNRHQVREAYRSDSAQAVPLPEPGGWDEETERLMASIGVLLHERQSGYLYPRTDQASTAADALVKAAADLGAEIRCGERIRRCRRSSGKYLLSCAAGKLCADRLILCTGGMVSPEFACQGDGYLMAKELGHTLIEPVPALCALRVPESVHMKTVSGVRTAARIRLLQGERLLCVSEGELQMTQRGLSGIPAFQVSRFAARILQENGADLRAVLDFLPEISQERWDEECALRLHSAGLRASDTLGDWLRGLVPDRVAAWILEEYGLVREKKLCNLQKKGEERARLLQELLQRLRCKEVPVIGTDGFERSQVTAGGLPLYEFTQDLESKISPGLYCAGEILDVDGACGGYNLTWAFHSGLLAGRAAVLSL